MRCIIIEDQAPAQRVLKKYISDAGKLNLVATFSDAIQAEAFLEENKVDLMFLDIHLPKISGMEFLKTLSNPPAVILTTAFSEYAVQSYELNVLDYLVKPFSFERFNMAVAKLFDGSSIEDIQNSTELLIKSGYEHIKISSSEILYFHSDMNYTEIHLSEKKHLSPETLQYWQSKLENLDYIRVHKSYLVNTAHVVKLTRNKIFLTNQAIVPLGRAYKEAFREHFMD